MTLTKDDFINWKHSAVTQVLIAMFADRVKNVQYVLGESAGIDPLQDRFHVGYIKGIEEILNTTYKDMEEDSDA